ncbi:MAG: hypothetical protein A2X94_09135 [Bdellovibrionales bacterium GWB1_55_8]|nr:MAG: hypothetical protein A2X94_09135 [Bdellovibrionales bacterium GWB1_55_8]
MALSFRFSEDGARILKVLSGTLNQTQVEVLESLLKDAYIETKKRHPREVAQLERNLKFERS